MGWISRFFGKRVPVITDATFDGLIMDVTWSDGDKEKYTKGATVCLRTGEYAWYRIPDNQRPAAALEKHLSWIETYIIGHSKPYNHNGQ